MSRDRSWPDVVVVSLALAVVLTSYRSLISGSAWFTSTLLVLMLVTMALVVGRFMGLGHRAKGWPLTVVATLVGLIAIVAEVVPQTLWVILPTPRSPTGLIDLSQQAKTTIAKEPAPVDAAPEIVLIVAMAFAALLITADVLLRTRLAVGGTGLLLLSAFAAPSLIVASSASLWIFLLAAALWLVLVARQTGATLRLAPAIAVAMCGLLGAAVFRVVAPEVPAASLTSGESAPAMFGRGINPMVELGSDLRRAPSTKALTLRTDLRDGPYLKVATLTDFTGKTWRPQENYDDLPSRAPTRIDPEIAVATRTTTVKLDGLRSEMLPTPYPPTAISLSDAVRWEQAGQTVRAKRAKGRGDEYTVTSLEITPTADQLRSRNQIPANSPDVAISPPVQATAAYRKVSAVAQRAAGSKRTVYDKALALQRFLREGDFEYSLQAPVDEGYDGSGIDVLATFMDKRSGYCVHFASAMTVMARSLDMPARIAVGYAPGERGGIIDGKREYRVFSDDLHAWTEIYFAGVGWVGFDPTPGIARATEFAEGEDSATADEDLEPTPEPTADQQDREVEQESPAADESALSSGESLGGRGWAAMSAAVLALALAPAGLRGLLRWWRLRPGRSVDALWREVEDTAIDAGITVTPAQTPRNLAAEIARATSVDTAALWHVLHQLERARFSGRPTSSKSARTSIPLVLDSMVAMAPRSMRWRARWLPRSLLRGTSDSAPTVRRQPA